MRGQTLFRVQGCTKGQKSGGAGSNAARRRCPAAPSDLPKSGGGSCPPCPPAWCIPVKYMYHLWLSITLRSLISISSTMNKYI